MQQESERLIADLHHPNPSIRIRALRAVGRPGSTVKIQISVLSEKLKDEDVHVRRSAANALSRLGEEAAAAIPSLLETLTGADSCLNQYSIKALRALGPKAIGAVPSILLLLKDHKPQVRVRAARALGKIAQQPDFVIPKLLETARTDVRYEVRSCAIEAIGEYGPRALEAVPALIEALGKDRHLQVSAAIALANIGVAAKSAIPALIKLLKSNESEAEAVYWAAIALGWVGKGSKESVTALTATLEQTKNWKVYVWGGVVQALRRLAPEAREAIPSLLRIIREEEDSDLLCASARALVRIDPDSGEEAIRVLVVRLKEGVSQGRSSAIARALGELGPDIKLLARDAIPLLAEALRTNSGWPDQCDTIRTLRFLSPEIEEAVNLLREASQYDDIGTKIFARNQLALVELRPRKKQPAR